MKTVNYSNGRSHLPRIKKGLFNEQSEERSREKSCGDDERNNFSFLSLFKITCHSEHIIHFFRACLSIEIFASRLSKYKHLPLSYF
ncbi:unnamed protein product [Brugia timori]|uniref:Ovule protein n=1 Tax=Brugia timori TaxID=42155 RepID=A0A0R3Q3D7_9BILA|nr:unnamed protein product [Brugia timori]